MGSEGYQIELSQNKRDKQTPMTSNEKEVLLELVNKYKHVVESKKTDFGTNVDKATIWKKIEDEFCATEGTLCRTQEQLKTNWKNLKQRAKLETSTQRKVVKKTGGGKGGPPLSAETIQVTAIIPAQMKPLENAFDDDAEVVEIEKSSGSAVPMPGPPPKKPKVQNDPKKETRDALVSMEEEEHALRMSILRTELETAAVTHKKAQIQKEAEEEKLAVLSLEKALAQGKLDNVQNEKRNMAVEHDLRVKLLQVQLGVLTSAAATQKHPHPEYSVPQTNYYNTPHPYRQ